MMGTHRSNVICLVICLFLSFGFSPISPASPVDGESPRPALLAARTDTRDRDSGRIGGSQGEDLPLPAFDAAPGKGAGTWVSALPSQLAFNPVVLGAAVENIGGLDGVYSLLVVRDGRLVVERYFREGYRTKPHNLKSASKSILSALVGIAIGEGLLGIDQPISEILPQADKLDDPRKGDITVRHLLTMTSGLAATSYQAYNSWTAKSDWVRTALEQPLVAEPGTCFQYSTGNTHLLSAVLTAATGTDTLTFAVQNLFSPMDITVQGWSTDPNGIYQGGNNLSLVPLDMAKLGQLYLDGGRFGGRQIVPEWWVDASTRKNPLGKHEVYGNYGYLWYIDPGDENAFVAVGYGGQYIYVSPAYRCVVVVTSTLISKGREWERTLFEYIHGGILGSIQTDAPQVLLASGMNDSGDPQFAVPAAGRVDRTGNGPSGPEPFTPPAETAGGVPTIFLAQALPTGQTTNTVILRSGPSRESDRLGLVPPGKMVSILDTQGNWHLVRFEDKTGWLHGSYVEVSPPELSVEPEPIPADDDPRQMETPAPEIADSGGTAEQPRQGLTRVRLKLRQGPSTAEPAVTTLEVGRQLTVKGRDGLWLQVEADGHEGWVASRYVRVLPPETPITAGQTAEERPTDEQPLAAAEPPIAVSPVAQPQATPVPRLESGRAEESAAVDENMDRRSGDLAVLQQRLETELEALRADSSRRDDITAETVASIKDLSAVLATVKQGVESTGSALETADTERDGLKAELAAQRLIGEKTLAAQQQLVQDLVTVQKKTETMEQTLDVLKTTRKNLTWNLTKVIEELESQREAAAQAEAAGKAQAAEAATLREAEKAELANIRREIKALGEILKGVPGDREALKGELAALKMDLKANQDAVVRAATERDGLTSGLGKVRDELEKQRLTTTEMIDGSKNLSSEIAGIRSDIKVLGDTLAETQSHRDGIRADLNTLDQELKTQQAAALQASSRSDALTSDLVKMREAFETQRQASSLSEAARQTLSDELGGLRSQIAALSESFTETRAARDNLSQELAAFRQELKAQQTAALQAASQRDALTSDLIKMREAFETQRQASSLSEAAGKLLSSEFASVRTQLAALGDTLQSVQTARESMIAELNSLRKELKTRQDADIQGMAERDHLVAELSKAREALEKQQQAASGSDSARNGRPSVAAPAPARPAAPEPPSATQPVAPAVAAAEKPKATDASSAETQQAPAVQQPEPSQARPPEFETVETFLRSWAEAWARKDVMAYLAHYSTNYRTPGGIPRTEWAAQRKQKILKPAVIEIEISNIRVITKGASDAQVTFDQRYQSNVFIDMVAKILDLRWEDGMWKIVSETIKAKS